MVVEPCSRVARRREKGCGREHRPRDANRLCKLRLPGCVAAGGGGWRRRAGAARGGRTHTYTPPFNLSITNAPILNTARQSSSYAIGIRATRTERDAALCPVRAKDAAPATYVLAVRATLRNSAVVSSDTLQLQLELECCLKNLTLP